MRAGAPVPYPRVVTNSGLEIFHSRPSIFNDTGVIYEFIPRVSVPSTFGLGLLTWAFVPLSPLNSARGAALTR